MLVHGYWLDRQNLENKTNHKRETRNGDVDHATTLRNTIDKLNTILIGTRQSACLIAVNIAPTTGNDLPESSVYTNLKQQQ